MASILQLVQQVCPRIGLEVVDVLASGTERQHVELLAMTHDVADQISRAHPWKLLERTATYTGDGSTTSFTMPSDYGWMPNGQEIWSSAYATPLTPIPDSNDWLGMEVRDFAFGVGAWNMSGGALRIKPELASGETAQHNYQTVNVFASSGGTAKASVDSDSDTFRLDERLFRLCLIYRWKQHKQTPYAQEMDDYEVLKEKLIARDGGPKLLRVGEPRSRRGATIAYPKAVG